MIYACGLKEPCLKCGNCCRFRLIKSNLSDEEELIIRKAIFYKKSILYPFSLQRITISITPQEKTILEEEAKRLNVKLKLLPNKVLVKDNGFEIIDYFIDADVCPFLTKGNLCMIYEKRPYVCRMFPKKPKFKDFPDNTPKMNFEDALKKFFELHKEFPEE